MNLIILVIIFAILVGVLFSLGDTFMFILLLIFSVTLIALLVYRNISLKKTLTKVPENDLHVLNLDKGGVFRLTGVGHSSE